jgi:hypothetical protein
MLRNTNWACCWRGLVAGRSLSYIARARQLQRLKEEDEYCTHQLPSAQFLLYSKGRPLLRKGDRQPLWVDYAQAARHTPDLEKHCVLLGVSEDGLPQLAASAGTDSS